MKKIISLLLALAMVFSLVACAKTDKTDTTDTTDTTDVTDQDTQTEQTGDTDVADDFDYTTADLAEYIKLGEYKGLTATHPDATVTEEDLETRIQEILSSYSDYEHITDRAVEEGDTVVLSYSGVVDGEDLSGGTAVDQEVVAADGNGYIDGFGSGCIGQMPGVEFEINTKFPDPYPNNEDLSGKEVTFKATISYIKGNELVEGSLTDEWVKENLGYDDVEAFKVAVNDLLVLQKAYQANSSMNNELWNQIVENSEVIKYPTSKVEEQYDYYKQMYEYYASYYGTDYETFLSTYVGITDAELYQSCEEYVKEDLVLYALTKELDSTCSDSEVDGKIKYIADMYNSTSEEVLSYYGEATMRQVTQFDKNMSIVAGFATITEGTPETAE